MRYLTLARPWFGLVSAVAALGVVVQVIAVVVDSKPYAVFDTVGERVGNVFSFFTILSNLIVAAVFLLLAVRPVRAGTASAVLVLDAVVAITVTGIVYNLVLAQTEQLHGLHQLANVLCHRITPLLAVVGWLVFGPRGRLTPRVVAISAVYPVAWLAFTLARGAALDWYPYPFLDVIGLGYGRVAINAVVVAVLFLGLGFGALALDRRLPGLRGF